uniref:MCC-bdg_PDZ domain-containing protein n=1 Tax=Mesocestoides corti TaxID=53468 RepID=A0A5K3FB86_MESCO
MGLRLHNQTRRPRILSQSSGGSNWIRRNSVQCNHTFQPTSEFSLNFDPAEQGDRLSKASSCDDRTRQSNSPVLSSSTSSVSQSCRSGDNFTSVGLKETEEPQWVRNCMSRCAGEGSGVAPSCTSAFVQTFLGGLAGAAPYQRLADFARCALLACEQREAACARQEAELTVLEASLAEAKAAGDQLQCRLGQIEASWGAAARAAELADMALETSGVLVHLYSSELALFLHKQPNSGGRSKSEKLHHPRSFARLSLSGSTFTSSSTSSTSSSASSDEDEHQGLNKAARSPLVTPNSRRVNSSTKCTVCQTAQPAISSDSGNNVYAVYAINGKLSDEGSTMPSSSWILPHTTCNGPACIRLLRMQRSQAEMVATNLLARFSSMPEPFFKPESLTFTAAEDFDPCTANCNRSTTAGTESGLGVESGGSSSGLGVCGMYANAWHTVGRPSGSTGQSFKSYGGWQTPDSGAGSCSTNDHTAATALVTSAPRPNAHSCSSHSSNSSSTAGVTSSAVFGGAGEWNRVKEFKLRHILDQIIWERMLVRNTIAVGPGDFDGVFSAVPQGGDYHNTKPYMRNEMFSYCEGRENGMATQDSKEPVISSRLSALLLVDTAALLQDLCAVREDRAKLKVQNYIMEKELRAIQLSLQGHCLSESTLRSQLNVLQINRNLQMPKTPERVGGQQSLTQQIEKLQAAFESLRKGTEQHQAQSEELVNDLKQANAALITAFEKAKNKYLARIRKLESQVTTPMSVPKVPPTSARPPVVPAHKGGRPPLPPVSPSPTSDVYEVIQDSHVPPPNAFIPPTTWYSLNQRQDATTSNPANSYSMVKTPSFYPKHPRPGG